LTIGLRVLNLDGTVYSAFSTTDVAETSTAGTYRKASGVVAPLAGGYIVWGTALVDYAEATVESAAVNVTMQAGVSVVAEGARVVEGTHTVDDILRIIAAALAGETSGSGTATVEILGLDGATTRITATLDGNGNRTSMTLDGT